jgi:hypothetical protein
MDNQNRIVGLLHGGYREFGLATSIDKVMEHHQMLPCTTGLRAMPNCMWFVAVSVIEHYPNDVKLQFLTTASGVSRPIEIQILFSDFLPYLSNGPIRVQNKHLPAIDDRDFGFQLTNLLFAWSGNPSFCTHMGKFLLAELGILDGFNKPPLTLPVCNAKGNKALEKVYEDVCAELVMKETNRFMVQEWVGLEEPKTVSVDHRCYRVTKACVLCLSTTAVFFFVSMQI